MGEISQKTQARCAKVWVEGQKAKSEAECLAVVKEAHDVIVTYLGERFDGWNLNNRELGAVIGTAQAAVDFLRYLHELRSMA